MKLGDFRGLCGVVAGLCLAVGVQAGTNDLFEATADLHCLTRTGSRVLRNPALINLALGNPLHTPLSQERLGLQFNCAERTASLVVYDDETKDTRTTIIDFDTRWFRSDGSSALVDATGTVRPTGFIAGGTLRVRMRLQLDGDACATQAIVRVGGTFRTTASKRPRIRQIARGMIFTLGSQHRTTTQTGGGNGSYTSLIIIENDGGRLIVSNLVAFLTNSVGGGLGVTNGGDTGVIDIGIGGGGLIMSNSVIVLTNSVGGGLVVTNGGTLIIGGGVTILPGGLGFGGGGLVRTCVGTLTVGADSTLNLSNLTAATNCALTTSLNFATGGVFCASLAAASPTFSLALGTNAVVNACTNGLSDASLAALTNNVVGSGTLNLLDCAPPPVP